MLSRISWTLAAWEDYQYWQGQDRKKLKRINRLIEDCLREPFAGIGKPELLKENLPPVNFPVTKR
jgi:toxin YoeB